MDKESGRSFLGKYVFLRKGPPSKYKRENLPHRVGSIISIQAGPKYHVVNAL